MAHDAKRLPEQMTVVRLMKRPVTEAVPGKHLVAFTEKTPSADDLGVDDVLIRVDYISLDPAMRGWMSAVKSYIEPVRVGDVMRAYGVGVVVASCSERYPTGAMVQGMTGLAEYATLPAKNVSPVIVPEGHSPAAALGPLGLNGLTAYFGLLNVGECKSADTVLVSSAAGATGSLVVQIAKNVLGAKRTVGIAGGAEKCRWLKEELGVDEAIDYKSENVYKAIPRACPDGVDVVFENVGGDMLNAALANINVGARIALCGLISQYNAEKAAPGPSNLPYLLMQRGTMRGFVVLDFASQYREAARELSRWVTDGKIRYKMHVEENSRMKDVPEVFKKLFDGSNFGKLVVKVSAAERGSASSRL